MIYTSELKIHLKRDVCLVLIGTSEVLEFLFDHIHCLHAKLGVCICFYRFLQRSVLSRQNDEEQLKLLYIHIV